MFQHLYKISAAEYFITDISAELALKTISYSFSSSSVRDNNPPHPSQQERERKTAGTHMTQPKHVTHHPHTPTYSVCLYHLPTGWQSHYALHSKPAVCLRERAGIHSHQTHSLSHTHTLLKHAVTAHTERACAATTREDVRVRPDYCDWFDLRSAELIPLFLSHLLFHVEGVLIKSHDRALWGNITFLSSPGTAQQQMQVARSFWTPPLDTNEWFWTVKATKYRAQVMSNPLCLLTLW